MVEFRNTDDIEKWLKGRPQRVAIALAFRSAVRVAPAYLTFQKNHEDEQNWARALRLAGLRAMIISGVASTCPTPEVNEDLRSAAFSADSALAAGLSADSALAAALSADSALAAAFSAESALAAAFSAESAVFSADSALSAAAYSAAFSAFSDDAFSLVGSDENNALTTIGALFQRPVWSADAPVYFQSEYSNFIVKAREGSGPWLFWADWVESVWTGKPKFPRSVLEQIALIEDAVWEVEDAPEKVAAQIREIIALERTKLHEDIFYGEETARFGRTPLPIQRPKQIEALLTDIKDAIDDALGGNCITENTYEIRKLRQLLERDRENPHVMEQKLVQVKRSLERRVNSGDLPDAPEVMGVIDVCEDGALGLRSLYPDVAKARADRNLQAVAEASVDEIALLKDAQDFARDVLDDEFADDVIDDLDEIIAVPERIESGAIEASTDALARSANRWAKIGRLLRKMGKGTAIGGAGTAGAIVLADEAYIAVQKWLPVLMRLLGL